MKASTAAATRRDTGATPAWSKYTHAVVTGNSFLHAVCVMSKSRDDARKNGGAVGHYATLRSHGEAARERSPPRFLLANDGEELPRARRRRRERRRLHRRRP